MRLFSNKRPKAEDKVLPSQYTFLFGQAWSGKNVNERSAMQLTAVYACVRVLSEALASLPLHTFRNKGSNGKEKATDHPLYRILHDEPNPEMTSFIFRETLMTHLLLWGNAYAQIIRNGKGDIMALYPLMPNRMEVGRDDFGTLYYDYSPSKGDEAKEVGDKKVRLRKEEVLHIPGLGFDGLVGYSPIAMAKNSIGMAMACEEYGSRFFQNNATPSGVLEHPNTVKDPNKIRDAWNKAFAGSSKAGKVAVLEEGMKYSPISISPEQAQFLSTRKFQVEEIARIFKVPPHLIASLDHATFSNIEHQSISFVQNSLEPWVSRWEQSMHRCLLREDEKDTYFFKMNMDGLMRGDYQSRMSGYATAIQNGFLSPNDIRAMEDWNLIPDEMGGNQYMVNGNMISLKQVMNNSKETEKDEVLEMAGRSPEE